MAIAESNIRTNITMPKELKHKIEEEAKLENRSFNNLIVTALQEYIKLIPSTGDQ